MEKTELYDDGGVEFEMANNETINNDQLILLHIVSFIPVD